MLERDLPVYDAAEAATYLTRVGRHLFDEPEELVTLQRIADLALQAVPGCDWSSLTVRGRRGRLETLASSAPVAAELDRAQYSLGEGPCLSCVREDDPVVVDEVATDPRWPAWCRRATDLGAGSVLAVPLTTHSDQVGALNLYAARSGAFDGGSLGRALVFAAHATTAARAARLVTGLQRAVDGRHLIGVAQGILMQRYALTLDGAFDVLRRYSNHTNTKLREIARLVVDHGGLPDSYVEVPGVAGRGTERDQPDVPRPFLSETETSG
jgi:GAF domain-containing protein